MHNSVAVDCREQEVTRLIRVDVSTSASGVLTVALSEQEKGFAPYRLDNCTGLKLHLRCTLHCTPSAFGCCSVLRQGSCRCFGLCL